MPSEPPASAMFKGRATDGKSAAAHAVDLSFADDGLHVAVAGTGHGVVWPYGALQTNVPIGRRATDLVVSVKGLPGVTVYVSDPTFAALLAARAPATRLSAFRWSGLKPGLAVGLAGAALFGAVTVLDISPSKAVARLMPETARQRLGDSVLRTLPVRQPCAETAAGRAALDTLAARLLPNETTPGRRVVVLDWRLVNAFAVPGGKVILTRGVIEKAASADELAGVLAHEIGHGLELHPESGLVRSVGFWALIQMVFTGTPGAIGNAGSLLAQLAYNRAYEREADAVALRLLRDAKISPKGFAGFFRRVDGNRTPGTGGSPTRDVFDTHPSTPERIRTIEQADTYAATPALTSEQWTALQNICRPPMAVTPPIVTSPPVPPTAQTPDDQLRAANDRVAAAPQTATVWYERGELHMQEKRYPDAIRDFTRATELEPGNAHFRYRRGAAHQDAQRHADAIADYTETLKLNPRHAQALAGRGAVHRVQKNADEAYKDFAAALAINPRQQYALYQRGLMHRELKRWADMERDFAAVIDGNRGYAYAYVRRGEAFEGLGQRDKAIADYRAALQGSPSSPNAEEAFRVARQRLTALGVPPG